MKLIKKIGSLNSGDILTLGIILGAFGADVFLNSNKVRVGFGSNPNEQFGNCPPGQVYNGSTYTCSAAPATTAVTTSPTVAKPAPTPTGLTFSGTVESLATGNLIFLTGNNDTIYAGGTSSGFGMPYWSGAITYSGGAFSGSWSLNGTPVITGSGNSITGNGITAMVGTQYASYLGSITYSSGSFNGVIYVSVAGSQPAPILSGNGSNIIGVAGANNTGFGGAINSTTSSTNVAGSLQSVITNLTAMVSQAQSTGQFASFSTWQNSSSGQHGSAAASVAFSNGAVVMAGGENANYGGCGGNWSGQAVMQIGSNSVIANTSGMFSSSGSIGIDSNGLFTSGSISINDTGVPGCARRGISFNISVVSPTVLNISVGGATSGGNIGGQVQVALATQQASICPSGYTDENGICLS